MSVSIPKSLLRSLLFSYLLSGILLLGMSFALYKLKLKEGQINMAVYGVYAIACLAGGLMSGKIIKNRRFFWGLLSGLVYFLILFAASWFTGGSMPPDTSRLITVLAVCAGAGTLGGMIS